MDKIIEIKKVLQEKEEADELNKPIELQLAKKIVNLLTQNERIVESQKRLIEIIENQQYRINNLSDFVGRIQEKLADHDIHIIEDDISDIEEEWPALNQTLTSQYNTEELYQLAADTIEYCSDGQILSSSNERIGLTWHIDDNSFFELTDEQIFLHTKDGGAEIFEYRTKIKPESLEKLMYLFESMADHHDYSLGEE